MANSLGLDDVELETQEIDIPVYGKWAQRMNFAQKLGLLSTFTVTIHFLGRDFTFGLTDHRNTNNKFPTEALLCGLYAAIDGASNDSLVDLHEAVGDEIKTVQASRLAEKNRITAEKEEKVRKEAAAKAENLRKIAAFAASLASPAPSSSKKVRIRLCERVCVLVRMRYFWFGCWFECAARRPVCVQNVVELMLLVVLLMF